MTYGRLASASIVAAAVAMAGWHNLAADSSSEASVAVDFARDVRPILAKNCLQCHGADPSKREAELRLDMFESPSAEARGAEAVVVPGSPGESELVARITSDDPEVHMPPADSGKTLKPEEVETLRNWIAQGAVYKKHWAFEPPVRPAVPTVADGAWVKNPIDAFVLSRLEHEGLRPSAPASAHTLVRRAALDLVGLPPSLADIEEFDADDDAGRYERHVERLLISPHFGERWGRLWLDAARYADSDGFEKDKPRFVWMYRDWVIDALNVDMPYDQFIIEQIAGDLLPEPTQSQQVATGFLRNSMINEEGGIDPEQFRMEAMFDRMDAIGKSVLGLTIQCAQCHTHKYDPIEHTDYYRLFAFLNNCDEAQIATYTIQDQKQWAETQRVIARIVDDLRAANPDWRQRMTDWEQTARPQPVEWTVVRPPLDASGGQKHFLLEDGSILAGGYAPTQFTGEFEVDVTTPKKITAARVELLNDPNLPNGGPGRSIYGICALTEFQLESAPLAEPTNFAEQKVASASADVNPAGRPLDAAFDDKSETFRVTGPVSYANDGDNLTAWGIDVGPGRSNVPHQAVIVLEKPIDAAAGVRLKFKLVQNHGGWNSDDNQNNNLGRFRLSVTDADKAAADPIPAAVRAILAIPAADRTPAQVDAVFEYWRTTVPDWAEVNRRLDALWQSHPRGTTQLALLERATPRPTHRLDRGNFLKPAEEVTPGTPAFLHALEVASPNRLDFARWLVDRRSPTTARTIVNRIWQAYFGAGLVGTAEDFGTQGDLPTHPELLDWLAVELMEHNWSLKHLHRLIVNSATYQQSSDASPDLLARDPANQLLARGPRYRVDAEAVRDIALAASGLLTPTIGGPSVYPPAPDFLFQPPTSYGPKIWASDTGPDKYRRALYTFRYRSVPYPMLQNFDAPTGDFSCVRRVRSNTPLQALTTLNEPLFIECARSLARKIVTAGGSEDASRLAFAVRSCLAREPQADELAVLQGFLDRQRERFAKPDADPWTLLVDKDQPRTETVGVTPPDLAAWTALARVVLNLDETITKE